MDGEAQCDLSSRRSNLIWSLISPDAQSAERSKALKLQAEEGKAKCAQKKKKKKKLLKTGNTCRQHENRDREKHSRAGMQGDRPEKHPGSFLRPADIFSNKKVLTALSGYGPSHRFTVTPDETTVY